MSYTLNQLQGAIFGLVVGDALGVPVEFQSRESLQRKPVQEMRGYGTYNQPPGTWSDDTSLTLCLLESLCQGYNLKNIAHSFVNWLYDNHWTPHGRVFDAGMTTTKSINRFIQDGIPENAGGNAEGDNGNGSLMRIIPLAFFIEKLPIEKRIQYINDVSSITHGHIRSVLACFIYIELALQLFQEKDKIKAYQNTQKIINEFIQKDSILQTEAIHFSRILEQDIRKFDKKTIRGGGYVVHALEASLWCFLKNDTYKEIVLNAVNLGEDTDTTAAIAGGLAGLHQGYENIPSHWLMLLARKSDISVLISQFYQS